MNNFYELFVKVEVFKGSDGQGGFYAETRELFNFYGGLTTSKTVNKSLGEQYSILNTYSLIFPKEVALNLGDLIKRVDNNKLYKIVNDPNDFYTPRASSLNLKQAIVTRYILPQEVS